MWRMDLRGALGGLLLVVSACGFEAAGMDIPDPSTVGFAFPTTNADEASDRLEIVVALDKAYDLPITVGYHVTGGSAMRNADYALDDGLLTFEPGVREQVIGVTILADTMEEPDETIELQLVNPHNVVLGATSHTISISADILPRVAFSVET